MYLEITIAVLVLALLFCFYLLYSQKTKESNPKFEKNLNQALKNQEELLKIRLESLEKDLAVSSQTLSQINTVLLSPLQRGHLGNTQLEHLLSLYLPTDGKSFQLEYRMKKPTSKGGFLIVDAFLFGLEGKNNLAIDSKFPLENYLLLNDQAISELERKEAEKKFKENLKDHIKKVAEYISEDDNCPHALIFFPSEAIFAKIQETNYESVRQLALDKKVSLCSPVTLAIIINQILWATKTWEEYRSMDKVLVELRKFWEELVRFQDRWEKIKELVLKNQKLITDFDITVDKIIKQGERIKKREVLTKKPDLLEKENKSNLEKENQ
jgi:DNA recombination protein RmuC